MKTGTYSYSYAGKVYPRLELTSLRMRVEVLEELGKYVRIKFLEPHADGRPKGTITRVLARKVRVDKTPVDPAQVRLPYKD